MWNTGNQKRGERACLLVCPRCSLLPPPAFISSRLTLVGQTAQFASPPWNTSTGVRKRQQPLPWPLLHTLFVSLYLTIKKMAYFIYSTGKIAFCLNSSSSKIISVIWGHVAVKIYKNACPRWVASWNRKCVEKISRAKAWNSLPVVPLEQDQVVWQISIWLLSKISRLHLAVKDYQLRQELFTLWCAKWFQQQQ